MSEISREHLDAYLDDALSEAEHARLEQELRESGSLRLQLRTVMTERDRGEHSLGAIWRHERLTCPDREKLGTFLLGVLDDAESDYIGFHLNDVGCPFCQANVADLREQSTPVAKQRVRRMVESSVRLLPPPGE